MIKTRDALLRGIHRFSRNLSGLTKGECRSVSTLFTDTRQLMIYFLTTRQQEVAASRLL